MRKKGKGQAADRLRSMEGMIDSEAKRATGRRKKKKKKSQREIDNEYNYVRGRRVPAYSPEGKGDRAGKRVTSGVYGAWSGVKNVEGKLKRPKPRKGKDDTLNKPWRRRRK